MEKKDKQCSREWLVNTDPGKYIELKKPRTFCDSHFLSLFFFFHHTFTKYIFLMFLQPLWFFRAQIRMLNLGIEISNCAKKCCSLVDHWRTNHANAVKLYENLLFCQLFSPFSTFKKKRTLFRLFQNHYFFKFHIQC